MGLMMLPPMTDCLIRRSGHKTTVIQATWILFILLGMGAMVL